LILDSNFKQMKIKIKYTAQLKKTIGTGEEIVEVDEGILLKDLMNGLFQKKREAFTNIVFNSEGDFLDAALIILNGQQIRFDHAEALADRDEVVIMSPIAGG
jgi:MoaD family protein